MDVKSQNSEGDIKPDETEFVPPEDGSYVPRDRLNEVTALLRSTEMQLAELRGRVKERDDQKATQPEEKTYTRNELQAMVDDGKVSEQEMDRILDRQTERRIERAVQKHVGSTVSETRKADRIETELQRYKDTRPDAWQEGSELRMKLADEYRWLTQHGSADSLETELAALRTVLGPADKLQNGKPARETWDETGGGDGGGDENHGRTQDGMPKGLTPREKAYYTKKIDIGVYKDWNAVAEEMKHSNSNLRRRHGARI